MAEMEKSGKDKRSPEIQVIGWLIRKIGSAEALTTNTSFVTSASALFPAGIGPKTSVQDGCLLMR